VLDGAMWHRRLFSHLTIDEPLPTRCTWPVGSIILTQIDRSAPPDAQLQREAAASRCHCAPRVLLTGHDRSSLAGVPMTLVWLHPMLRMTIGLSVLARRTARRGGLPMIRALGKAKFGGHSQSERQLSCGRYSGEVAVTTPRQHAISTNCSIIGGSQTLPT